MNTYRTHLSIAQERALKKLTTEWLSAYDLQESRATLGVLVVLGYALHRTEGMIWHGFNERTAHQYRLNPRRRSQ